MKQIDPKNDIVFTPANIADLMCTLAGVNENSVVIDNTAGAGALMQAASRAGAKRIIGIEFEDIPFKMLSENLGDDKHFTYIQGDGMKYSELIDRPEEINVVLSNPPYSAEDGGMIFADEIMKNMKNGMAVILTKSNVQRTHILEHSTLKSVVTLPDIFKGFASVQTALYIFECGRPHDIENDIVKFVDFSVDGYRRSGRKTQKGQVLPAPGEHPEERYKELVELVVNNNKESLNYYKDLYVEDTLKESHSWMFSAHRVIDTTVTIEDFKKTVADYLSWKVGAILRGEIHE